MNNGCGKYINYKEGSQLTRCGDIYVNEQRLCRHCKKKSVNSELEDKE